MISSGSGGAQPVEGSDRRRRATQAAAVQGKVEEVKVPGMADFKRVPAPAATAAVN